MSDYEVYRCTTDGHYKQWAVVVHGCRLVTRYGKIGGTQQVAVRNFAFPSAAHEAKATLVAEKLRKGYRLYSAAANDTLAMPAATARAKPVLPRGSRRMLDLG